MSILKRQPITILYLEDDPAAAAMFRERLIYGNDPSMEFEVECVESLKAGLERLSRGGIDAVLTDLKLTDSEGLGTFLRIHAHAPQMPIIVFTGSYAEEELGTKAIQQGAQDYPVKGEVDGKLLSHVIRYAIERKRVEAALQAVNEELKAKLNELERLTHVMMNREERILELKEEVERMRAELQGRKEPP